MKVELARAQGKLEILERVTNPTSTYKNQLINHLRDKQNLTKKETNKINTFLRSKKDFFNAGFSARRFPYAIQ